MGGLDVVVRFLGDSSKLQAEVGKVEKSGSRLKTFAKGAAAGMAGAFAIDFAKDSISAAREAEEAVSRLDNVFKSMGDSTGQASKDAQEFAGQLSKQTAIEDETIMAAQAMLATFGAVSDETARSSGIFDRATTAAADLAAAGFGTMEGNATLLGKALNDPANGLGKLAKNGVTFTEQQKEQIKAMQESGDVAGAQALMLKEVERQVGGTAEATADGTDKMKLAYGEMQESVGTALLGIVEKLAPIITAVAEWASKNTGLVAGIAAFTAGLWLLNAAMSANPVVLIVAGIAALVAGIVIAYHKFDWFRTAVDAVWQAMQDVWDWISRNWPLLLAIILAPFGGPVILAIIRNFDKIKAAAQTVYQTVQRWFGMIASFVSGVVGRVQQYARNIGDFFAGIGRAAKSAYDVVAQWLGKIAGFVSGIVDGVSAAVGRVVSAIKGPINGIIDAWNGLRIPEVTIGGGDPLGAFGPSIPKATIGGWDFPNIRRLDAGGLIAKTGLAVVHQGEKYLGVGNDEMALGGTTVTVYINVDARGATDPYTVGKAAADAVENWGRVSGTWRPGRRAS